MQEEFLHHIWYHQVLVPIDLYTTQKESLQILHKGDYTQQAGPDFFNAQIVIGNQKWAGNIEIHIQSSDWYLHHHEQDSNYDNVILHVVWEHDVDVFRKDNTAIPVLQLKDYIPKETLLQYEQLRRKKSWINCEESITAIPQFIVSHWKERLYLERLEQKVVPILQELEQNAFDWEQTFFLFLAKNFGLNTNGEAFYVLAKSIPFSIVRKERENLMGLEALFFGQANLLSSAPEDIYGKELCSTYSYLKNKYGLQTSAANMVFFRLRPDNFPTIRIAQLAMLYHKQESLFAKIIACRTRSEILEILEISVSQYWYTHYNFERDSKPKDKKLSKSFIDLLLVNTIVPMQFAYQQYIKHNFSGDVLDILEQVAPEKNTIIDHFKNIGIDAKNVLESQALIQLKKEYCDANKCLHCAIGLHLLKK